MATKVGIIGSGVVGRTLAAGFHKHGFEVLIGTNTPSKLLELASTMDGKAQVGSFSEAASFGEIVVVADGINVALRDSIQVFGPMELLTRSCLSTKHDELN